MKMTFRWYGENDSITLKQIAQIPCVSGVVTAVYGVPVGQVWQKEDIKKLKDMCDGAGLEMQVIESVPVHEDIKLGLSSRDKYIQNYCKTIENLAYFGVKCICYNFMPVFDWVRTDLRYKNADGSLSLRYDEDELKKCDLENLHLPGWDESYSVQDLKKLLKAYEGINNEKLWDNLVYFLKGIMPTCEKFGINMAIHPDDPPWSLFSLPRIITGESSYERLIKEVPSERNGFTFCTGSLGADRQNDLSYMAKKYAKRIFFAHIRQIRFDGERNFTESGHLTESGSLDIADIVKNLVSGGFTAYVRPDHGRNIWDEDGKAGYGLYDRALGAMYLKGLFEAFYKEENKL